MPPKSNAFSEVHAMAVNSIDGKKHHPTERVSSTSGESVFQGMASSETPIPSVTQAVFS